jgi:hypothetical protein
MPPSSGPGARHLPLLARDPEEHRRGADGRWPADRSKEEKEENYLRAQAQLRLVLSVDGAAAWGRRQKDRGHDPDGVVEVTIPLPAEPNQEPVTITPTAA